MAFPFFFNRNGARKFSPFFRLISFDAKKRFGFNIKSNNNTQTTSPPEYESIRGSFPQSSTNPDTSTISSFFENWSASSKPNHIAIQLPKPDWNSIKLSPIVKDVYNNPHQSINPEEIEDFRELFKIELNKTHKGGSYTAVDPVFDFVDIEWPTFIAEALRRENFENPTPIQSESWPILLKGNNLVGVAETGSGKTLAYALPALFHLTQQKDFNRSTLPKVLIIAPVRELAMQICNEINKFAANSNIRAAVFYGGGGRGSQINQLRYRPQIIVATPGRLIDVTNTRSVNLKDISYLVLDEADRLLDMGFAQSIQSIREQIRPDRQIAMFTATWPQEVRNLARDFMGSEFVQLTIGSGETAAKNVKQHVELCSEYEKEELLKYVLEKNIEDTTKVGEQFRALVFCNRKGITEVVGDFLNNSGMRCAPFHGDIAQDQRQRILQSFRDGRINVLVASDAASRGLDVKNISLVVNYEFPLNIETYIHRIGRTGRGGAHGLAVSFLTKEQEKLFPRLAQLLRESNQPIPPALASYLPQKKQQKNQPRGLRY
jgi:ATP-dependent RNA helicase DDX5/DBP2